MLAAGVSYESRRTTTAGALWRGVVDVEYVDGAMVLVDEGAWVIDGGQPVKGTQRMVVGDGFVEVVQGFEVHRYEMLAEAPEGWAWAAGYKCGADEYWIKAKVPTIDGWILQMGVVGPQKDEVQVVAYY